jgi:glyoxylase-like metal-dependent hydrolase (beta-lactamase superfamily II)
MREIMPGIFTWPWFAQRFGYDFNGYFLPEARLVIDPVEIPADVLPKLAPVAEIFLTNRNHFRDAQKLKQATGGRVLVHGADRAFVESKGVSVDGDPGPRVGPFDVVPVPGKSPGEVALHWPERRLLLVGDACVGKAPGVLGLLPDAVIDDKTQLLASLRRLLDKDFDTLLVADGHSILNGAHKALEALLS